MPSGVLATTHASDLVECVRDVAQFVDHHVRERGDVYSARHLRGGDEHPHLALRLPEFLDHPAAVLLALPAMKCITSEP